MRDDKKDEGDEEGRQRWEQWETTGVDRVSTRTKSPPETSVATPWTRQPVKKHE